MRTDPSNYLTSGGPLLPPFPVRAMCEELSNATLVSDPWALLAAFNAAGNVFNNATQNIDCYVLPTDLFLDGIWDYQYCTETLPEETYFTRDGVHDSFWPMDAYNKTAIEAHCFDKFGVKPRWTWIREQYGGVRGGSNIVFTNGGFDPWSSGGILPGSSRDTPSTPAFFIPEGAHHLDLFFSNPEDPASVTSVRKSQIQLVHQWAEEWRAASAKEL
jgi:lysosomal Pro-X carboxypeptidase